MSTETLDTAEDIAVEMRKRMEGEGEEKGTEGTQGTEVPGEQKETQGTEGTQGTEAGKETPKTPEQKPVETEPDPEKDATEEDRKDLPKQLPKEQVQAFIRERIRRRREREAIEQERKKFEEEKAQWQKEREQPPARTEQPAARPAARPAQEEKLDAPKLGQFMKLRAQAQRVMDGYTVQGLTKDEAGKILTNSNTILAGLSDEALVAEVVDMARAGQLGEEGQEIAAELARELPLVQTRARRAQEAGTRAQQEMQRKMSGVAEAVKANRERYPALKDPKSEEAQFVLGWMAKHVGNPKQPGRLFKMAYGTKEEIATVFDLAMDSFQAQKARKMETELAQFKKRQALDESPLGGAGAAPAGAGAAQRESSDSIKNELLSRNPGWK